MTDTTGTLRDRREAVVASTWSPRTGTTSTRPSAPSRGRATRSSRRETSTTERRPCAGTSRRRAAFPDQRNELRALHHTDDAVITEFDLLGTHLGPLRGIPPTGKTFRCPMTAFFVFEGDRIVCERVYFDSATILRQLGLMP
jgi:steroid delta-isomerase-like uncharacterized protein